MRISFIFTHIMIKISRLTVAFLAVTITANAFVYQPRNFAHRSFGNKASSSLDASYDPYSSGESCNNNYKSRTDLRQFLTQRSIQSFVFLLNQCKEGATIRWLEVRPCREKGGWLTHRRLRHHGRQRFSEFTPFFLFFLPLFVCLSNEQKQLDFKKIDSYHGTGAFNTTLFPEWDSIFLQLVMQDQETIIIEVEAQKKSHRGWAHQGNYLDGISSSGGHEPSIGEKDTSSSSSSTQKSSPPDRKRGPSGSYLAHLNSASTSARDSSPGDAPLSAAPKVKPKWQPISKASGAAGSYLESLNQQRDQITDKTNDVKSNMKNDVDGTGGDPIMRKEEPNGGARKSSGMKAGYLDGLSSNTIESANQDESALPSNGLIENPHLESVSHRIQLIYTTDGSTLDPSHQRLPLSQKTIEYQFEVDPASLVTRMLSVREQISKEWKDDLATLVRTNERILDEYEEQQRAAAVADDDGDDDDVAGEETRDYLKDLASPYRASQEDGKTVHYDRNAMVYLTNSIATQGQAASPFRRSNFDLLLLLCTQESIHRVLSEYKGDSEDEMHLEKYDFLNSFYKKNVQKYFDGHEYSFGRGDQFLEAFLKEPRIARTTQKGNLSLIDPVAIMEDLLRERSRVAREWKSIINTIPDEHLDLRRILFNRHLMESSNWGSSGYGTFDTHIEESVSIQTVSEPGAFE